MCSASLWNDSMPHAEYRSLDRDLSVDVAIVGAGITGLTAAWLLKEAGQRVAVLDAFCVGAGATGSSTGHLTVCLDADYQTLVAEHGEAGARAAAQSSAFAIDFIEDTSRRLGIACGLQRVPGYLCGESPEEVDHLEREAVTATRLGLTATRVREVPLPFPVAGGLRFERQGQLEPMAYLRGLARRVDGDGCRVLEQSPVQEVEDGTPCRIVAGRHLVRAGAVVLATHTPLGRVLSLQARLEPRTSYVVAARVDEPPTGLFWDLACPYHYLRSARGLVLIGGSDHRTGQEPATLGCYRRLEEYARARFAVRAIEHRWSEQVFESPDGLPCIGRLHRADRVFVGTGYGGTGLTFGTVAAVILSDLVTGHASPWSALMAPTRFRPVAAAKKTARAASWRWVAHRLRGPDADRIAELAPGAGRIVEIDGQRAAVYRDRDERVHILSPVCTHAGCTVQWNQAESTWDCRCHGGRFDPLGRVLCGPPVEALERLRDDDDEVQRPAATAAASP